MTTCNSRTKEDGMSLVEVIMTMFILTVLVMFYASALNTLTITRKVTNEDLAYHVANKEMEVLRDTAYASLPASGSISDSQLSQIPSGSGSFTVTSYPGYTGMKEIVITVSWNDGASRSVVLRTLAGTGGINP